MTTVYLSHEACLEHQIPAGHPERPDRLRAIENVLKHERFDKLQRQSAPMGTLEAIALVHPERHVDRLRHALPEEGLVALDGDTSVSPGTWDAAVLSVGAATKAIDLISSGDADNCFCGMRPPGHHATTDQMMGFCFFNNAAIAAKYARTHHEFERVAIFDFDVHHGNGTQEIFWSDPDVLYCSTHNWPFYPGTGALDETGADGLNNIVNAPLSVGSQGFHFRDAVENRVLPAIEAFSPDLLILSAGFDAHHLDPLGEMQLTADDFSWVTGKLLDQAGKSCDYRLVSLLEGGYDLEGLSESVSAHVDRLLHG
ncbi:MAG: histone deacetylase family protein [Cohaesibacteraceae bacterium]|nr:histone deacetylase family protein [Cohaesibacteraceae bacterium]